MNRKLHVSSDQWVHKILNLLSFIFNELLKHLEFKLEMSKELKRIMKPTSCVEFINVIRTGPAGPETIRSVRLKRCLWVESFCKSSRIPLRGVFVFSTLTAAVPSLCSRMGAESCSVWRSVSWIRTRTTRSGRANVFSEVSASHETMFKLKFCFLGM